MAAAHPTSERTRGARFGGYAHAARVRNDGGATQRAQTRGTLIAEVSKLGGIVRDLRKMTHLVTINPVI